MAIKQVAIVELPQEHRHAYALDAEDVIQDCLCYGIKGSFDHCSVPAQRIGKEFAQPGQMPVKRIAPSKAPKFVKEVFRI